MVPMSGHIGTKLASVAINASLRLIISREMKHDLVDKGFQWLDVRSILCGHPLYTL